MLQLIVTACLLSAPGECQDHYLTLETRGMNPSQCLYSSVPKISHWQVLHPNWVVSKWRCALIDLEKQV